MIMFMLLELTVKNMKLFFPSWEKPLSNKEIIDFLNTPIEKDKRLWYPEWDKNLSKRVQINLETKKYNTKKEIKQDIKILNDRLDWWLEYKHNAPNEMTKAYCEIHLEDLLKEKENLNKKLRYTGVKFENDDLERARQVPINDFLKFNSARMTKCLWHTEKTPSLHMIKGKNKVYCFGGCGTKDVIEVVQNLHNCTFGEALKIILK